MSFVGLSPSPITSGKAVSIFSKPSSTSSNFVPGTGVFGVNKSLVLAPITDFLLGSDISSTLKSGVDSLKKVSIDQVYYPSLSSVVSSAPTAQSVSQAPSVSSGSVASRGDGGVSVAMPDYLYADLAKLYGMDASTAYQEALSNTSYQRAVSDLKAAGLNPILAATGLHGASGVSYVNPISQSGTVGYSSSSGISTGTTSGKSLHTWYKTLTNIGTIVGAAFGHPIIGSSVGSAIGNLLDMAKDD